MSAALKTYWHLQEARRRPSDYEIGTSKLLYYTSRGFEVSGPIGAWYDRYQRGSALACPDWDLFRDPRQTTYTKYVEMQREREAFVDGLLASADSGGADRRLSSDWVRALGRVLGTLRYPGHGLQMVAAYCGSMAPSGKLVVANLFQAADEMRRIQRLTVRMRQLRATHPTFAEDAKSQWQSDPAWQPLRKVIERLLVTYDWGEATIALELVVKPIFDDLFMTHFACLAIDHSDSVLSGTLFSLREDCLWQRAYALAFVRFAVAAAPANVTPICAWIDKWYPPCRDALAALGLLFDVGGGAAANAGERAVLQVEAACRDLWESAGLTPKLGGAP